MNTTQTKKERTAGRQKNGQYAHNLVKVCRCGLSKGKHQSEAPFEIDDIVDGVYRECAGFKLAK